MRKKIDLEIVKQKMEEILRLVQLTKQELNSASEVTLQNASPKLQ